MVIFAWNQVTKKIESNICLLIGLDVPEALERDEIRKSMEKEGPMLLKQSLDGH